MGGVQERLNEMLRTAMDIIENIWMNRMTLKCVVSVFRSRAVFLALTRSTVFLSRPVSACHLQLLYHVKLTITKEKRDVGSVNA